jgi:magnesium transporter
MASGKAKFHDEKTGASEGFSFVVPCVDTIDPAFIKDHLERDHFFWLDLTAPTPDDANKLRDLLGFHPLALQDMLSFGQRPKLDTYEDHVFLVFYGAHDAKPRESPLREVQMFISGKFLVTVHAEPMPGLDEQRKRLNGQRLHSEQFLLYRVFDALTDSFFPLLSQIDDEIDQLEDDIIAGPTDAQLQRLFTLKRELVALRKVVTPQRDMFARSIDQLSEIPGLELDERDYFRDVYDHLIRISDLIDSYRDLLGGATDLYVSTVGNRQNEVMKQLAIVGTIFLPLSWMTGFFGQNFGWLVRVGISPTWTFFVFGIGTTVATVVFLRSFFKRKGWM